MQNFLILTIGYKEPTPEIIDSWVSWFEEIKDRIVIQGGCGKGREITPDQVRNLPEDLNSVTGFLVIKAGNINEAEDIAKKCPAITSTHLYEFREPS